MAAAVRVADAASHVKFVRTAGAVAGAASTGVTTDPTASCLSIRGRTVSGPAVRGAFRCSRRSRPNRRPERAPNASKSSPSAAGKVGGRHHRCQSGGCGEGCCARQQGSGDRRDLSRSPIRTPGPVPDLHWPMPIRRATVRAVPRQSQAAPMGALQAPAQTAQPISVQNRGATRAHAARRLERRHRRF